MQQRSFIDDVSAILSLQPYYSAKNTPQMSRRGSLIRHALPAHIYAHIAPIAKVFGARGFSASVEGSDGMGNKLASAWVRIFDAEMSSGATKGWYVVFHFSSKGDRFFAALGCGATIAKDGQLTELPDQELAGQIAWAKEHLAKAGMETSGFHEPVELHGQKLSGRFERAIAVAKSYSVHDFVEGSFWADVATLCRFLVELYSAVQLGKAPMSASPEEAEFAAAVVNGSRPGRKASEGQGYGLSYLERCAVEMRAMKVACDALASAGFEKMQDVSSRESFDYLAVRGGEEWPVEVKGTTAKVANSFFLTAPEHKLHSGRIGKIVLVIVRDIDLDRTTASPIATGGIPEVFDPWSMHEWDFLPAAYQARRKL